VAETLSSGLTLIIPSAGDVNWQTTIKNSCFQKISEHDHTGAGKGVQIATAAIADGAITTAKLGSVSLDASKIASDAITTIKIIDGAVTAAKLGANAVTGAKIRLENNVALRTRNAANDADLSVLYTTTANALSIQPGVANQTTTIYGGGADGAILAMCGESQGTTPGRLDLIGGAAAGDVIIGTRAASAVLNLQTNGTARFQLTAAGMLIPVANNSYDIGATSYELRTLVCRNIGTYSGTDLKFFTGGTNQWRIESSNGGLMPEANISFDIGSETELVRSFKGGNVVLGNGSEPAAPFPAGTGWVIYASGGNLYAKSADSVIRTLAVG